MTLPASGPISAAQLNAELDRPWNTPISLNDPAVRELAGKPGPISFSDLHGKTANPIHNPLPFEDAGELKIQYRGQTVTAFAKFEIDSNEWRTSGESPKSGDWHRPTSATLECWLEITNGTPNGNTAADWVALTAGVTVSVWLSQKGLGHKACSVRVHVRVIGRSVTDVTKDIRLGVTVESDM